MKKIGALIKLLTFFLPWPIRRLVLNKVFRFKIDRTARIGYSWIFPKELVMQADSYIDHFTVAINLEKIEMGMKSTIGRGNWITGFPTRKEPLHFRHQPERKAHLVLGEGSAITKKHHIDCTNLIVIGRFSTIAGYNSQLLTHSIDFMENRQSSAPIFIGDYSFVGTNTVILGGASLPSFSILAAKSLLNKYYTKEWMILGGVPAKELQEIPKNSKYFNRTEGFVY